MDNLKYPKADLMRIGANYIGSKVLDGVYWYSYENEPNVHSELTVLTQRIISMGELVKNILDIKRLDKNGSHIITINRKLYEELANEMFNTIYQKYPELPKLKGNINIDVLRDQEIKYLADYIKEQKTREFDIYLYKTFGEREHTIILHDNDKIYKKRITGFYLTEKDLEDVNILLAENNLKIGVAQQKELSSPKNGLRYTLTITQADFISTDS